MKTFKPSLKSLNLQNVIFFISLIFSIIWIIPVFWILVMSFKPNDALMLSTSGFLPIPFTIENFKNLFLLSNVPLWLKNSLIVAFTTTVLNLIFASLAGYAFARLEFFGKNIIFILVIAGLMVPEQAVFIPLHVLIGQWELHNTHFALIFPKLASPFGVFLMTQFFKAIPKEIEEAAMLDYASRLKTFTHVILPLSIPALTTLGLFTFMGAWNDYLWPLVSATDSKMYTVTVGLASIQSNFAQSEGLGSVMASAVFASAPLLLLYIIFQKYIVSGIAMGGTR